MAVAAVPAAAAAGSAAAGSAAAGGAAAGGAAAGGGAAAAGAGGRAAAGRAAGGGRAGGGRGGAAADLVSSSGGGGGKKSKGDRAKSWGKKRLSGGGAAKYRRWLVAEFIVCVMLLGLANLAKPEGQELTASRFMKRGSATCALFIVLGILSSAGRGAAKAAGAFGALVTLVLLVDQREAFGRLARMLNAPDVEEGPESVAAGPPDDEERPWAVQI